MYRIILAYILYFYRTVLYLQNNIIAEVIMFIFFIQCVNNIISINNKK